MKTTIYYFTGTGNSLAVAKDLARELGNCEIISMTKTSLLPNQSQSEIIGLVFPVYYENLPDIVKRFLERMWFEKHQYIFAIATHNTRPGNAIFWIKHLLELHEAKLSAGFEILMPGNMIAGFDASTKIHEQHKRINNAKLQIKQISNFIQSKLQNASEIKYSIYADFHGKRNYWLLRKLYPGDRKFWTTTQCTQCRICEKVCPTNNIVFDGNQQQRLNNCEYCLACLHWCPVQAQQNGRGTLKYRRYHHPDVTLHEMLQEPLAHIETVNKI